MTAVKGLTYLSKTIIGDIELNGLFPPSTLFFMGLLNSSKFLNENLLTDCEKIHL